MRSGMIKRTHRLFTALVTLLVLIVPLTSHGATPIVVNFDDLANDHVNLTGSDYAGLTWELGNAGGNGNIGFWITSSSAIDNTFPHSATHNLVNGWGSTQIAIDFPSPVNVQGAYIAAQGAISTWSNGLTVEGYLAGQLVETTAQFTNIDATPDWFAMDLNDVDQIVFKSVAQHFNAGYFGMDDLTYTPLPEPSTLSLLSLLTIPYLQRRR